MLGLLTVDRGQPPTSASAAKTPMADDFDAVAGIAAAQWLSLRLSCTAGRGSDHFCGCAGHCQHSGSAARLCILSPQVESVTRQPCDSMCACKPPVAS